MSLPVYSLTQAASDTRLCVPSAVLARLPSATLEEVESVVDHASILAALEEGLGRPPWRQGYRVTHPGATRQHLYLPVWPVEGDPVVRWGVQTVDGVGIGSSDQRSLVRPGGWPYDMANEPHRYEIELVAGWLMPGQVETWAASTGYALGASRSYGDERGSWVRSSNRSIQLRFELTVAGITGAAEPAAFRTAQPGAEIVDGTAVWTARGAFELPANLREAAADLAVHLWNRRQRDQDVRTRTAAGVSVTYATSTDLIPPAVEAAWSTYR